MTEPVPALDKESNEEVLKVLLSDYSDARSDERTFQSLQLTLLAVCVALLSLLSAQVTSLTLPDPIMACLPLAALAILGVFAMSGAQATVRSYYMRELEAEIAEHLKSSSGGATRHTSAHISLMVGLSSLRPGRGHSTYKAILVIVFLATLVIFGGVTAQIALRLGDQYLAVMVVGYGCLMLALLHLVWQSTVRGDRLYETVRSRVENPTSATDESDLLKYLLLPRPEDLQKIFLLPGFWIGFVLSANPDPHPVVLFIWCWIVIEFLAYQARYQWNDIRGLSADLRHPQARYRRRLPVGAGGVRSSVRASAFIIVARLLFAIILAVCSPAGMRASLLVGILGVFLIGGLYEWSRERGVSVATVFLVPVGYPLRFAIGFLAGGATVVDNWVVLAWGALLLYAWGMAFVGLTWALEAADFIMQGQHPARHVEWFLDNSVSLAVAAQRTGKPLSGAMQKICLINVATSIALLAVPLLAQALFGGAEVTGVVFLGLVSAGELFAVAGRKTPKRRLIVAGVACAADLVVGWRVFGNLGPGIFIGLVAGLILFVYCAFRAASYKELKSAPTEFLNAARARVIKLVALLAGRGTFEAMRTDPAGPAHNG